MSRAIGFISRRFQSGRSMPRSARSMRAVAVAGVALAVAALVVAVSIGRGFESAYRKALLSFNAHIAVMGLGELRDAETVAAGVAALRAKGEGDIRSTTPFLYREGLAIGGGEIRGVVVKGIDPASIDAERGIEVELFDAATPAAALQGDVGDAIPALVGEALLARLDREGVGERFTLMIPGGADGRGRMVEMTPVGRFASGMHDYDAQFLLLDIDRARDVYEAPPGSISGVEVMLNDPERAEQVARSLEEELGPAYRAVTWGELNGELLAAVRLERLTFAIIMGMLVIVAGMNIIAVLVLMTIRRLPQLSMLKALGLSDRGVRALLIRQGLLVGAIGAGVGLACGIGAAWAVDRFALVPLEPSIYLLSALPLDISPVLCGLIALFCLGVAYAISGFAARRLAAVPIAEGLHRPG